MSAGFTELSDEVQSAIIVARANDAADLASSARRWVGGGTCHPDSATYFTRRLAHHVALSEYIGIAPDRSAVETVAAAVALVPAEQADGAGQS